jgi:hypothetical protein
MKKRIIILSIILALLLEMTLPMAAYAGDTGTTLVTTDIDTIHEITVPASIELSTPPSTSADASSAPFTITVNTNDTIFYKVYFRVNGIDGKLSTGVSSPLNPALQISSTTMGWANAAIGEMYISSPNTINASSGVAEATDIIITQPTVTNPLLIPPGEYQETLTFTAMFTN